MMAVFNGRPLMLKARLWLTALRLTQLALTDNIVLNGRALILALLAITFVIAFVVCLIVARIFDKPIDNILKRIIADDISGAWLKYLKFAIYVVGISSGVRIYEIEKYVTPQRWEKSALGGVRNR